MTIDQKELILDVQRLRLERDELCLYIYKLRLENEKLKERVAELEEGKHES